MGTEAATKGGDRTRSHGPTKTESVMTAQLSALEPGTRRHHILECAIRFKRSWVELAQHLADVEKAGLFKEWGFRTFEAYAQHELHLRRETVEKLVRSYDFLSAHERDFLDSAVSREGGATDRVLPSYRALDILAEARQNPELSERDYRELRDRVFCDDPPPNQLRKMLRGFAPDAERASTSPDPGERLRRCLALAERLYGMLLEEDVPPKVTQSAEKTVGFLRELVEE